MTERLASGRAGLMVAVTRVAVSLLLSAASVPVESCKTATPIVPTVTATDIVRQNALDAFDTFLITSDRAALQDFRAGIAGAHNRQDLLLAWANVPSLRAKGSDFLTTHVFEKAVAESRWPTQSPQSQLDTAFVTGVQQAVDAFLQRVS